MIMNVSGVSASMAAASSSVQTGDAVAVSVQKKAMDIESANAQQLIESVAASAPKLPSSAIDLYA